jgi:peptidoglycan LD-endopeptidase CwlK
MHATLIKVSPNFDEGEAMTLSARSLAVIESCHPDLKRLAYAVAAREAVEFICGHRDESEQNQAFKAGKSKLRWPNSMHNRSPSHAIDLVPKPIDWKDLGRFEKLSAVVKEEAEALGIKVRWGADWNSNGRSDDERFLDYPHWELVGYSAA